MTDHTEIQIPGDVMEAALKAAYKTAHFGGVRGEMTSYGLEAVVNAIATEVAKERERCARIAENLYGWADIGDKDMDGVKRRHSHVMLEIAAKIRSVDK